MDLQINLLDTNYQLTGSLNKLNVYKFKKKFLNIFDKQDALIINIEQLTSIDRYGVNALAQLHNKALINGKTLSIIGMGSDDLYEHIKSEETAA